MYYHYGLLKRIINRKQREEAQYEIDKIEAGSLEALVGKALENGIDLFDPHENNGYVKNNSAMIEKQLGLVNPNFNSREFVKLSQRIFTDLCKANSWEDLDDEVKPFVDKDFNFASLELKEMAGFSVSYLHLYKRLKEDEILQVCLAVLENGQSDDRSARRFFLRFKRPSQFKVIDFRRVKTTACPNCGGPVFFGKGNSAKCEYCGQYVTFEEYGWLLSEVEEVLPETEINNVGVY